MNRITIMGVLAALALIMAPGFAAQAASISPDIPAASNNIETPDVESIDVADVGDIETPDIETPEVEAPEIEVPELGE